MLINVACKARGVDIGKEDNGKHIKYQLIPCRNLKAVTVSPQKRALSIGAFFGSSFDILEPFVARFILLESSISLSVICLIQRVCSLIQYHIWIVDESSSSSKLDMFVDAAVHMMAGTASAMGDTSDDMDVVRPATYQKRPSFPCHCGYRLRRL